MSPAFPALALLHLLVDGASGVRAPMERHEAARVSMGCTYAVEAHGPDLAVLETATQAALDEVDRIDRLMSHYRPDSSLSRINQEAAHHPVPVEPELLAFLARCQDLSRASGGAFDITVGPLMKAWGFFQDRGHVPGTEARAQALVAVGYRKLVVDQAAGTVRFTRAGMSLDLGGIGKGYAVDRAVAVLRRHGVASALVSAGGSTVYALGHPPGAPAWSVTVRIDGAPERALALRDRALSVSGLSPRSFLERGVRYGHVLDPRSGRPVPGIKGVVVIGATGTDTDGYDQVLFVLGPRAGFTALPPDYQALVFLEDGQVQVRNGP